MKEITEFISQVGFPIFVAIFMLVKNSKDNEILNKSLNDLKNSITELSALINNINDFINGDKKHE